MIRDVKYRTRSNNSKNNNINTFTVLVKRNIKISI